MKKNPDIQFGDIFELEIADNLFVYFQFISKDLPLFNSDCIRFYKLINDSSSQIDLSDVTNSGTWFFSHTYIQTSLNKGEYRKIGHFALPQNNELGSVSFHSDYDLNFPLRLRKIGQDFKSSIVEEAEYLSKLSSTWNDTVMGPEAFKERIRLKLLNPDYKFLY